MIIEGALDDRRRERRRASFKSIRKYIDKELETKAEREKKEEYDREFKKKREEEQERRYKEMDAAEARGKAHELKVTSKGNLPSFLKEFLDSATSFGKVSQSDLKSRIDAVYAKAYNDGMNSRIVGKMMKRYLGWSLPTKEGIALIKQQKVSGSLYDVLAGSGYWTKSLNNEGIKTIASDIHITAKKSGYGIKPNYGKVSRKNAVSLASKFANKGKPVNVLMSWLPGEVPVAALDLPIGSILFLVMDTTYLHSKHKEYIEDNYAFLNSAKLVDTGARANMFGDKGRNSKVFAYNKTTSSNLRIESCVHQILNNTPIKDVINRLLS